MSEADDGAGASPLTSAAAPEMQQKASSMGWIPPERFKGDPDKFVDADAFVERGEQFLPFLKANNAKLQRELAEQRAETQRLHSLVQESREAVNALKEFQSEETKRQVKQARADVVKELAKAQEAGDFELHAELTASLAELTEVANKAKVEAKPTPPQEAPQGLHPDTRAWMDANPWFGVDEELTALTQAKAQKLRRDPANASLQGRAFYDRAAKEAYDTLHGQTRTSSKVDGSGGGKSGGGNVSVTRAFKDLPTDAKAQCAKQSARFVGEGKAFKTEGEWQNHFAKLYTAGDE